MIHTFSDVKDSRYALPMSVAQPGLKVVELSKEDKEPKASESDYSRVNDVNRDVCEVKSVRCPSATSKALCIPSCLTSQMRGQNSIR
jgi:hypothetical protein